MLLQNELAAGYGKKRINEELHKIRNSEMMKVVYSQSNLKKNNKSIKMLIMMFMLKYKMYLVLVFLLSKGKMNYNENMKRLLIILCLL